MPDTVELIPAPNSYFDHGGVSASLPGDELSSRTSRQSELAIAYAARVVIFERDLDAGRQLRYGAIPADRYPTVHLGLPGDEDVLVDDQLDQRLLQVYAVHGWAGVQSIEASLERAAADRQRRLLYPWAAIQRFFLFTRNWLALRIRSALVELERHAADQVVLQLNQTAALVTDALVQLHLETTSIGPSGKEELVPSPSWDTPSTQKRIFYRLGNRDLAQELYPVVSRAVQALDDLRTLNVKVAALDNAVRRYGQEEPLEATRQDLATARQHLARVGAWLELLLQDVADVLPMAVLVLPLLSGSFNQGLMEHRLGEVIKPLQEEPERLVRGISSGGGWVGQLIPDWDGRDPLEQLLPPGAKLLDGDASFEKAVVSRALDRGAREPAYLPLLSEKALDRIVRAGGPVSTDSFTFIVWAHYKAELISGLEAERVKGQQRDVVLHALDKFAAMASLLLLLAPAGVVARLFLGAIGFGLLAYQTYSVVGALSLIDKDVDIAVIEIDRSNLRTLRRLSELQSMRAEYVDQIGAQAFTELSLVVGAGAFAELKLLLHWRGYYYDLQTLTAE